MDRSIIDDNGNLADDDGPDAEQVLVAPSPKPKYFINAAELSEPEEFLPEPVKKPHPLAPAPKRRVPISKSFPDIVQTTMAEKVDAEKTTPTPIADALIPDSLENLSIHDRDSRQEESKGPLTASSILMGESGLWGVDPPEVWASATGNGSGQSSLSFFVNMEQLSPPPAAPPADKKIFSMFVDMGEKPKEKSNKTKSRLPERRKARPMEDSTRSSILHVSSMLDSSSSFVTSQSEDPEGEEYPSQLGSDLLRMFQEGTDTDVQIIVGAGRIVRAHRCILASRSPYFASQLAQGPRVTLAGFSYPVVVFALSHIYSGEVEVDVKALDVLELAGLAHLLGLEGLKESISAVFKSSFAHNFHRPCTGCITGVLETLPVASSTGMEELARRMIKWISRHFLRIWPTKAFGGLGDELRDACLDYSLRHLSVDNILDHTLGADQLATTMPSLRWTQPIFVMVQRLAEACVVFVGQNLHHVLQSQKFLQFGKGQAWNISRIEGTFVEGLELLTPDVAILSHNALTTLTTLGTENLEEVEWSAGFVDFLLLLSRGVESYLLANGSRAVLSRHWETLDGALRRKICGSSFVGYDKQGNKIAKSASVPAPKPTPKAKTPTSNTKQKATASIQPIQKAQPPKQIMRAKSNLSNASSTSRRGSQVSSPTPTQTPTPTSSRAPTRPRPRPRPPIKREEVVDPAPKKTFLSNSAKAAAVSKPLLTPRKPQPVVAPTPTPPPPKPKPVVSRPSSSRPTPKSEIKSKVDCGRRAASAKPKVRDTDPMSRSTIEGQGEDSGRMRTLGEIGRSSTFSKDEPTILSRYNYDEDYE